MKCVFAAYWPGFFCDVGAHAAGSRGLCGLTRQRVATVDVVVFQPYGWASIHEGITPHIARLGQVGFSSCRAKNTWKSENATGWL